MIQDGMPNSSLFSSLSSLSSSSSSSSPSSSPSSSSFSTYSSSSLHFVNPSSNIKANFSIPVICQTVSVEAMLKSCPVQETYDTFCSEFIDQASRIINFCSLVLLKRLGALDSSQLSSSSSSSSSSSPLPLGLVRLTPSSPSSPPPPSSILHVSLIDQLLLALSDIFIGNPTSTFSSNAALLRQGLARTPARTTNVKLEDLECYGTREPAFEFRRSMEVEESKKRAKKERREENKVKAEAAVRKGNRTTMAGNVSAWIEDRKGGEEGDSQLSPQVQLPPVDTSWKCQPGKISDGRHEWYIGEIREVVGACDDGVVDGDA
eukprot:764782-Hanusia_phi.AAC.8